MGNRRRLGRAGMGAWIGGRGNAFGMGVGVEDESLKMS